MWVKQAVQIKQRKNNYNIEQKKKKFCINS